MNLGYLVSYISDIYNGNFVVTGVSSDRIFTYKTSSPPTDGLPTLDGDEKVVADTDTVSGASPYIFNISLRSVFGMCGMHDGSKSTGFKSMVVAQYTGVGLQKDDNAFLLYNETNGQYDNNATVADSEKPLYLNSQVRCINLLMRITMLSVLISLFSGCICICYWLCTTLPC